VSEGRREEFRAFTTFSGPHGDAIPDPQSPASFSRSKLPWQEREGNSRILDVHRTMLRLRRDDAVLAAPSTWADLDAIARGALLEVVRRSGEESRQLIVNFTDEPQRFERPSRVRSLFVSGALEGDVLLARSAALMAD
jgi:1,4-alpha-glucan branching enzyme